MDKVQLDPDHFTSLRKESGLSQTDVSKKATEILGKHVNQRDVSHLESGRPIEETKVKAMLTAVGIENPEDLIPKMQPKEIPSIKDNDLQKLKGSWIVYKKATIFTLERQTQPRMNMDSKLALVMEAPDEWFIRFAYVHEAQRDIVEKVVRFIDSRGCSLLPEVDSAGPMALFDRATSYQQLEDEVEQNDLTIFTNLLEYNPDADHVSGYPGQASDHTYRLMVVLTDVREDPAVRKYGDNLVYLERNDLIFSENAFQYGIMSKETKD